MRSLGGFLDSEGFVEVSAPILTPSACEGTSTLFSTPYFGETAYLSQSGQLYNEAAIMALGGCAALAPPSGRRSPRPGVTLPSSGCWNLKPRS